MRQEPQFASARDAIADLSEDMIAAADEHFRYIYFNDAYRREFKSLWGIELELGAPMLELLAPWPNDLALARELWGRALRGESFTFDHRFGPPGLDQAYELRFQPLHDAQGRRLGAAHF